MSRLKKNLFVHTYPHLAADKATKEQSRPRRSPEKISHKENEKPKLLKSWTEEQRMHFMKLHVDEKRSYQESLVRWKKKFRTVDPPARSTASGWKAMYEETNGQKTCKEGRPGQPKKLRDAVKAQWVDHINEQWSRDLALEHNEEQLKKLDELARDDDLARGGNGWAFSTAKKP